MTQTACPLCQLLGHARASEPRWIADLTVSSLYLGEHQAYPGYAVLVAKTHCREAHELPLAEYQSLMLDLRRAALAVERASGCAKLNIASLGNVVAHSHWHLFPRQADESELTRLRDPWSRAAEFTAPVTPEIPNLWITRIQEALACVD